MGLWKVQINRSEAASTPNVIALHFLHTLTNIVTMQQALAMKQLTVAVGAVGRAFASASEGAASTIKYNPAKGPKAAYVPADARTASENARDLFRR